MSKPFTPGWPEAGAFPFMPFAGSAAGANTGAGATPPLMQGLTGGVDLMKDFWSRLPGGAPLPGFMVPTLDVEELDKRITDLKAAEKWVEVNLNLLRATIQGLEVQRHTIAAIRSFATPVEQPATTTADPAPATSASASDAEDAAPAASPVATAAAAANWLAYLQDQFTQVARSAIKPLAATAANAATKSAKSAAPTSKSKPASKASRKSGSRKAAARKAATG